LTRGSIDRSISVNGTARRSLRDAPAVQARERLVLAPYSREQERDADRIGIELAAKAGWDPTGLPSMLHTLEREEALAGNDPSRIGFFASFRPLRRDERDRITEVRLRPRPARAGESLADLIRRTGGVWKVEQTAVANGIAADAKPAKGFAVRVPIRQRYTERPPAK
jgi:predicted Zn-dependent protease